jgi:ribosomal protein S18 acetylase RimI-like enzyme
MAVTEVDPTDRRALNRFIRMEREAIGDQPQYTGELLDADVRKRLSGKSAFSREMSLALFATGRARCAAIVNPVWQRSSDEPATGSIGYFASAPGAGEEVADLLTAAEGWLAARGMTRVIAPFNGSAVLGAAALTDAFEESPMFPFPWNPPYYEEHLTRAGYRRAYPLWYYDIDFSSDRYRARARQALADPQAEVRQIDKGRWREEIELGRVLINEGFAEEWEFHQFTPEEYWEFWKPQKTFTNPRLSLIAEVDGEPAGFTFAMPDLTPAFRAARGRLGPLKVLRLVRTVRRPGRIGLLAIGVRPRFRGRRIGALLAARLWRNIEQMGYGGSSYYVVNDDNTASRRLAESFGGEGRILYHCFDKRLD